MSRRYQELVEVRLGDPVEHRVRLEPGWARSAETEEGEGLSVPTLFLWQGRVHVVRGVLAQWSQRVPWWCPGTRSAERGEEPTDPLGPGSLEQQVWRVEATAGRSRGSGVYDLVSGERWRLERVSD